MHKLKVRLIIVMATIFFASKGGSYLKIEADYKKRGMEWEEGQHSV